MHLEFSAFEHRQLMKKEINTFRSGQEQKGTAQLDSLQPKMASQVHWHHSSKGLHSQISPSLKLKHHEQKLKKDMRAFLASPPMRVRKDSGFSDDCSVSSDSCIPQEDMFLQWNETILGWSAKTHSIIQQEFERMQLMTEKRNLELQYNPQDKEIIVQMWKNDVDEMMTVANDLIQCVANDITETNSVGTPSESDDSGHYLTSHELGKILEEELFQEQESQGNEKIYFVRASKKSKKSKRRAKPKALPTEDEVHNDGWKKPGESYTIQVEEIVNREYSPAPDIMTGSWQWQKDLESPIIWNEGQNEFAPANPGNSLTRRATKPTSKEINEIFWDITLGKDDTYPARKRRISEVLDNLPFPDQPDIFEDRCELLEASRKRKQRKGKKPVKAYWNIFDDWKKIFHEPKHFYRKKRADKTRGRPRQMQYTKANDYPGSPVETRTFGNEQFSWFKFPEKHCGFPKNYISFHNGQRMRENGDEDPLEHQASKKQKMNNLKFERNWAEILMESERSLESITNNIEEKIKMAFRQVSLDNRKHLYSQEFSNWSLDRVDEMIDSREEFTTLRDEVRQMRKRRHMEHLHRSTMMAFQEWRWIMDGQPPQDGGLDEAEVEDILQDWLNMMEHPWQAPTPLQTRSLMERSKTKAMKRLVPKISEAMRFKEDPFPKITKKKCKLINAHKPLKHLQQRMVKSQAKQPKPRGLN
eukprot:maker-scaffold857_size87770-snap-gene-0.27 protein:Tk01669 transcript:maker-scaffold857_size87770-snap-gene-0.27-mRNA-1 annotation:"glycine betaine l-proline transport atp binding subunit"